MVVYAAGQILTAGQLQALSARRTTDASPTNNNTSWRVDDQMWVSVEAGRVYELSAALRYATNATADFKIGWQYPAGLTMRYDSLGYNYGTGALALYQQTESSALAGDGAANIMRVMGLVIVGVVGGTLQLQWGQNTATAVNTYLQAGSYMRLLPLA